MGGQKQLKFHTVIRPSDKERPAKLSKKLKKKTETNTDGQYDPNHLKKRKKKPEALTEIDQIPSYSTYLSSHQEIDEEPINYSLPKKCQEFGETEAVSELDPDLPLDLSVKKHESVDYIVEKECVIGEPPPLEPIKGREKYVEYLSRIDSSDIQAKKPFHSHKTPVHSLPPLILPSTPPVLLPHNPVLQSHALLQQQALQANQVPILPQTPPMIQSPMTLQHTPVLRNIISKPDSLGQKPVNMVYFEIKLQNNVCVNVQAAKLEKEKYQIKKEVEKTSIQSEPGVGGNMAASPASCMVQTKEMATGNNVGVFRTFRNFMPNTKKEPPIRRPKKKVVAAQSNKANKEGAK